MSTTDTHSQEITLFSGEKEISTEKIETTSSYPQKRLNSFTKEENSPDNYLKPFKKRRLSQEVYNTFSLNDSFNINAQKTKNHRPEQNSPILDPRKSLIELLIKPSSPKEPTYNPSVASLSKSKENPSQLTQVQTALPKQSSLIVPYQYKPQECKILLKTSKILPKKRLLSPKKESTYNPSIAPLSKSKKKNFQPTQAPTPLLRTPSLIVPYKYGSDECERLLVILQELPKKGSLSSSETKYILDFLQHPSTKQEVKIHTLSSLSAKDILSNLVSCFNKTPSLKKIRLSPPQQQTLFELISPINAYLEFLNSKQR
jgi:hypothetical protein